MNGKWQYPHRRWNPLRQAWVMVSPHRTQRPWQGEVGQKAAPSAIAYDPECYLCPGNKRAGGAENPQYDSVFTFVNDYAALLPELPAAAEALASPLLAAEAVRGLCKVLCFHPDHSLTLARMTRPEIRTVVDAWTREYAELSALDWIEHVQIFENRGAMMGASNPHPHCQIWSTGFVPDEPAAEMAAQRAHLTRTGCCLLCDYLAAEQSAGERIIFENDHFAALVPWWAVWPFETLLMSKRHLGALPELSEAERDGLADVLKRITTRYDNLFETSFPYTMGFHQAPTDGAEHPEWHFHAHFYPPLLRSATVRKFMVGFEMLGMPQRDITAESAAERLRACSEEHFWPRD
ncbi:MAG TPA: UDP-glucose--hexose-1-phosphate uridylyltransferase [Terracidiphilus sp.]|nr:UDP-glucose--hexose-1-phosphate uridylyltransferase [Terracidiphilus sp.]